MQSLEFSTGLEFCADVANRTNEEEGRSSFRALESEADRERFARGTLAESLQIVGWSGRRCRGPFEEGRVEIRTVRRDSNEAAKKAQKASEITEDDLQSAKRYAAERGMQLPDVLFQRNHTTPAEYDRLIAQAAKADAHSQRLMQLPGIGPTTASALLASIGNGHEFASGRQLAAWIGLTPGQYSSGGKPRLGRITKAGDAYLRSLLVMGARAILSGLGTKQDRFSRWARSLQERRGYWRAAIAIAAKNARLAWAVLHYGEDFRLTPGAA